ncbi:hypothetical protein BPO_2118 [Bergeyella porcorum]|uniref:Uncharacterized protein n=1 Tax=Bergeyella porcorum TaxID=1735111 RepID=A0AAU0F5Y3_9FLAO
MKKIIYSSMLVLTVGLVSAKDIQMTSNNSQIDFKQSEFAVAASDAQEIMISEEEGSKGCRLLGKAARIAARLLGADKEEAKEIGEAVEDLCNELT